MAIKKCGICGAEFSGSEIECQKCGSGIFESEKSEKSDYFELLEKRQELPKKSHSPKTEKKKSWFSKIFSKKNTKPEKQSDDIVQKIYDHIDKYPPPEIMWMESQDQSSPVLIIHTPIAYKTKLHNTDTTVTFGYIPLNDSILIVFAEINFIEIGESFLIHFFVPKDDVKMVFNMIYDQGFIYINDKPTIATVFGVPVVKEDLLAFMQACNARLGNIYFDV